MEAPETKPVKTLDELWCWQPSNDNRSLIPLERRNSKVYRLTTSEIEKGKVEKKYSDLGTQLATKLAKKVSN